MKLKFIGPLLLFVALGIFLFVGLFRDPRYVPSPLIGKPAPEFTLPSLQDASYPVSSKELLGQPWVLNVWGTWCGGCRQEHDTLLTIAAQRTVPIVGLNWKDDNAAAQQWLRQLGNPYAVVAAGILAELLTRTYHEGTGRRTYLIAEVLGAAAPEEG